MDVSPIAFGTPERPVRALDFEFDAKRQKRGCRWAWVRVVTDPCLPGRADLALQLRHPAAPAAAERVVP